MINLIFNTPYLIRIISTLIIILLFNKIFDNLIISVLVGTITLALWSGHSLQKIFLISWERFSSIDNIFLMIIIFQIIYLSSQMQKSNVMNDLVINIRSKISQKASLAVLPAIIGLLPMPGGALFSAPMIDDLDHDKRIENHLKTKINYWFRHIWEYWWPLYPGVLLAISFTRLDIWQFMLLQFPLSIFSIIGGYIFLLRKIKPNSINNERKNIESKHKLIFLIMPILIIVFVYTLIKLFFPVIFKISQYLPIMIGIIIAQVALQIERPLTFNKWKEIFLSFKTIKLTIVVALIRIYGAFIETNLSDGTLIMDHIREELLLFGIPIILIIIFIPFICGVTTGIAVGFVGASFPIVINILGMAPSLSDLLSYTVLAYASGYIGMILSPVHICLLVTNEYFKTDLFKNIFQLIKPASIVFIGAVLMFIIIRLF